MSPHLWLHHGSLPARHRLALVMPAVLLGAALVSPCLLACAATAQDADTPAQPPEPPLDQKITVSVEFASLEDLCKILEEASGLDFGTRGVARDRKVTVFIRDRPLREVVDTIAEITHLYFAWVKEGPGEGRHLFYEDDKRKAEREGLIRQAQRERDKKRREGVRWMLDNYLGALDLAPDSEEWDRIKEEAPQVWLAFRREGWQDNYPRCLYELVRALPRGPLEQSLAQGVPYKARGNDLSPGAQELLPHVYRALLGDRVPETGGETPEVPWQNLAEVEVQVYGNPGDGSEGSLWLDLNLATRTRIMFPPESPPARDCRLTIANLEEGMEIGKAYSAAMRQLERESQEQRDQREKDARETYADDPALMDILGKEATWPAEEYQGETSKRIGETWTRNRFREILGMVSREADLTIYAQYFMQYAPWWPVDPSDKVQGPFLSYLLKLEDRFGLEWELRDRVLLVTYPDWYERLEKEVPERLLARWRKRVAENGRVDFDHLIEICTALSDEQVDALADALHPGDEAAPSTAEDYLGWGLHLSDGAKASLRFMGSLNKGQRKAARSFLLFSDLSPAQQDGFRRLASKLAEDKRVEIDSLTAGLSVASGYQEHSGPVEKITLVLSEEQMDEQGIRVDPRDQSLVEKYKKESRHE